MNAMWHITAKRAKVDAILQKFHRHLRAQSKDLLNCNKHQSLKYVGYGTCNNVAMIAILVLKLELKIGGGDLRRCMCSRNVDDSTDARAIRC